MLSFIVAVQLRKHVQRPTSYWPMQLDQSSSDLRPWCFRLGLDKIENKFGGKRFKDPANVEKNRILNENILKRLKQIGMLVMWVRPTLLRVDTMLLIQVWTLDRRLLAYWWRCRIRNEANLPKARRYTWELDCGVIGVCQSCICGSRYVQW